MEIKSHSIVPFYNLVLVKIFFLFKGWSKRDAFHVCITSYNIAVTDHRAFKQKRWNYLILDEVRTYAISARNMVRIVCKACLHILLEGSYL